MTRSPRLEDPLRAACIATVTAILAALAPAVPAVEAPVALADGAGTATASIPFCESVVSVAVVHVTLARPADGPSDRWAVAVEGSIVVGCPAAIAVECVGTGRLGDGVSLSSCQPARAGGVIGPAYRCSPGPMAPPPVPVAAAPVHVSWRLGTFDARVALALAGEAADDVPDLCV